MLLPQFTTRRLFLMTAGLGLLFLCINRAFDGQGWAIGVSLAFVSAMLLFGTSALLFFFVWVLRLLVPPPTVVPENPFATEQPPEQIIEPINPDL